MAPGQQLIDYFDHLYCQRKISAKDYCTMADLAHRAGLREGKPLAKGPNKPSGHYQRLLNDKLPYLQDRSCLYFADAPASTDDEAFRGSHTFAFILPHEALFESFVNDPDMLHKLQDKVDKGDLPPCYHEHPLVVAGGKPMVPISLYADGLPYALHDSVTGFWLKNEITDERMLLCLVRKSIVCKCGCRGWCTMHTIFAVLAWSLRCLAAGQYPSCRHDGSEFGPGELRRKANDGTSMGLAAACIYIKGDWSEYATTFGLPTWADTMRPCYKCLTDQDDMYELAGLSPLHTPWTPVSLSDYSEGCKRCEVKVELGADKIKELVGDLKYDARSGGSHGRRLTKNHPELGLRANDRVEPSQELPDVGELEQVADALAGTTTITFWRPSAETSARHRNPIFAEDLGTQPARVLVVDSLHALYLGVMLVFCRSLVWKMIEDGFWGSHGTKDEILQRAGTCIRSELKHFYHVYHEEHPLENLTKVHKFSFKKLGEWEQRALKTKGAETWGFFLFLISRLQGHLPAPSWAPQFLLAATSLEQMCRLWSTAKRTTLRTAEIQASHDLFNICLHNTGTHDDMLIPKRHLCAHLIADLHYFGNPKQFACWIDEAFNRNLKLCLREVSQITFEPFALLRFRKQMQEPMRSRGAKRSRE